MLLLSSLAAILRFYYIAHQSYWGDEDVTVWLLHHTLGQTLHLVPTKEASPPLYYVIAWVWTRIFGLGEAGTRSLSAVCGIALVPVIYGTARRLFHSPRAGLIAAALAATNPLLIWYSQETRPYEMLVLATAVSFLAFAYVREAPRPLLLGAWAVSCMVAFAVHYYAVLTIVPQAALLLYGHRRNRAVWVAVALVGVCLAVLTPLLLHEDQTLPLKYFEMWSLGYRITQTPTLFLTGTGSPAHDLLKWLAYAALLGTLVLLWRRGSRLQQGAALTMSGIAAAAFLMSLAFVMVGQDSFLARNLMGASVPAALLVVGGLDAARARRAGAGLTAVFCAIGMASALGLDHSYVNQKPDWQAVARVLGPHPSALAPAGSRRLIVTKHNGGILGIPQLAPYMHGLTFKAPRWSRDIGEVDVILVRRLPGQGRLCWWGAACNLMPSAGQSTFPLAGFHVAGTQTVKQFTIVRLIASRPRSINRGRLARMLHERHWGPARNMLIIQR